ncbi:MAG: polysaccharide deacetylase family protein [Clostridia bacterium]|nr:polysaccharide deacetylase family protein [Clostridia bacterium]
MDYVFLRFPQFKDKALTFSYDDGFYYDRRLVDIFNKYGLKGTFNLNSSNLVYDKYVKESEIKSLYLDNGHEVAVHGLKHISPSAVSNEKFALEVLEDRRAWERITGKIVKGMAYANGAFDDEKVDVLKSCGFVYARTVLSTGKFTIPTDWFRLRPTCHHNDKNLFEYLDKFLSNEKSSYFWSNEPKLFYVWGHSFNFENDGNWDVIEKFASIAGNRDDVWYANNMEIYRYVKAYDSLLYSVDEKLIENPSAIDVYIDYYGKNLVIPAGGTVEL